jgi:hypothetical protein
MTWVLKGSLQRASLQGAAGNQLVAWTSDPTMMATGYNPGTGKVLVTRCYVDQAETVNNFYTYTLSSGSGCSNSYIGLYNNSGTLLGRTGDISSNIDGTAGPIGPLAAQSAITGLTYNQEIYLVLMIGAGTTPQFLASRSYGQNMGMTSDYRWQSGGSGLTALPSTLPSLSQAGAEPPFLAVGP